MMLQTKSSICKSCVCMHELLFFYLFLYVLQQEGGGSQIVHWDVKEALDLFLMEVHGDQVGETCTDVVSLTAVTLVVTTLSHSILQIHFACMSNVRLIKR